MFLLPSIINRDQDLTPSEIEIEQSNSKDEIPNLQIFEAHVDVETILISNTI